MPEIKYTYTSKFKSEEEEKSEDDYNYEPPYKVGFPGQRRRRTSSSRYDFRNFKDPRLGAAQRKKDAFYAIHGLNHDDQGDTDEESEDETLQIVLQCLKPRKGVVYNIVDVTDPANIPVTVLGHDDELTYPDAKDDAEREHMAKTKEQRKRKSLKRAVKNEAKMLKNQDCRCAEKAIKFYNEKHATDYEIVETLGSYGRLYCGFWYHCNFKAQRKSKSVPDDGCHSSPKLFFAELYRKQAHNLVVKDCKTLDVPGHRPDIVSKCKLCRGPLLHPANGFEVGK
ncbi:hypothetical protein KSS87_022119 [Heliosperma pusillum]|nr:hypothetical protein KSS87_022119 [Heliosperma pusillum]